ncbi:MAG: CsgG/HfaB family protein [Sulfurimonas sp.]|jgi:tetratricopeptide (TPR) repeat protein
MNKTIFLFSLLLVVFMMHGCAQRVNVKALVPAEIDRATSTKNIAITDFKNDFVGLRGKIESNLANQKINNQTFFTLVSRTDIDKVIREQKIQNSGLVETSEAVEVGNLIGAQAIISGDVGRVTSNDTFYYEERVRCADKKCKELVTYNVSCNMRVVGLSAQIRMIDIAKGDIIYADTMTRASEFRHCIDDYRAIPSSEIAAQELANEISNEFTYKLTPHYHYFSVVLLEDPDLDYNDAQEKLLESSLEYIKQNRYDKAEKLLMDLVDSTGKQSFVAFYNLGVVKEAQGEYKKAQEYYKIADNLMVEPVEEISIAHNRIASMIENQSKTQKQMAR